MQRLIKEEKDMTYEDIIKLENNRQENTINGSPLPFPNKSINIPNNTETNRYSSRTC